MDEVLARFESTLGNQKQSEDATNFDGLYKNWGRLGNQEERRKDLLQVQKNNRQNKLDYHRGILELVNAVEEDYQSQSYTRKVRYRPTIYVAGFHRVSPSYKNVLMLSEWLLEKPEDFHDDWYLVPCPKGVRLLLVATRGSTKFYSKNGMFKFECRTALPGGNPCDPKTKRYQCCVLDVVFVEKTNTVYVLDLLAWNNQPMTDCETEFRQYWLDSKFLEQPDLKTESKRNHVKLTLLPKTECTMDSLNQFMSQYPPFESNNPPLDGLLFYHKRAHYVSGETPLVGWLYPYMVPEVLGSGVSIHESYAVKPANYIDQATFIEKFEAKMAKWKNRSSRNTSMSSNVESMDSSEVGRGEAAATMEAEETTDTNNIKEEVAAEMESETSKHEISTPEKVAESVLNND